jgi:Trk K+ transport system NAD-binding subunit
MPTFGEATILIGGLGSLSWPVLDYLRAAGWQVVAIDQVCTPDDPRLHGVRLVRGDYRNPAVLQEAGVTTASGVLFLANDDLPNLAACLEVRRLNPTVRIVVRLFNDNLVAKLGQAVTQVVALSSARLAGPLLASTALTGELLANFTWLEQAWQIVGVTIEAGSSLCSRSWSELRQTYPGVHRLDAGPDRPLQARDRLVILGPARSAEALRSAADAEEALAVRWASRLRRYLRTAWRTMVEVETPVKIAAVTFFFVVLFGSVVSWLSDLADTWPRSLLRTLNIMVTAADLREREYTTSWQHVFISFLKLAGLLLTAAFTALLTNYLVRARLGGALAVRTIPESGHVVLCGLGTVGIRIVEALRAAGSAVVVIEKMEGGRFLAAARQKGATVLLGDGTLLTTLQRAHTHTARAFVTATSSDLANVEMALLARELNPKLRVVIRLDDGLLAESLRTAANIRYALGIPQLVAPAFVAPLFGDRVLSLFWLESGLHIVLEMMLDRAHVPGEVATVTDLARHLNCHVITHGEATSPVGIGQRVLAIVPVSQIGRLMKADP